MVVFVVSVRTVFHEVVLNGDDLFRLAGTQDSLQCGQCYWPRKAARAELRVWLKELSAFLYA